ncbi:MAG: hypothetical protein AAFV53_21885, partial [Myxococcota bacterium]
MPLRPTRLNFNGKLDGIDGFSEPVVALVDLSRDGGSEIRVSGSKPSIIEQMKISQTAPWVLSGELNNGCSITTSLCNGLVSSSTSGEWSLKLSPSWVQVSGPQFVHGTSFKARFTMSWLLTGCQFLNGIVPEDLVWSKSHLGRILDFDRATGLALMNADRIPSKLAWTHNSIQYEVRRKMFSENGPSDGLVPAIRTEWVPMIWAYSDDLYGTR